MKGFISLLLILPALAQEQPPEFVFRADARLIEVYATVRDHKGKPVDTLAQDHFRVLEDGRPQSIIAFEKPSAAISCALLLDLTGSMGGALPILKNTAARFIDELGDADSVAVYGFNNGTRLLQEYTTDKAAAKRAIFATRAAGSTALFDAMAHVSREVSRRKGKKVVIVFTDGMDNSSVLNRNSAEARARRAGVPIYSVAQGEAIKNSSLLKLLSGISKQTGGIAYEAREKGDIGKLFAAISEELQHTYLLAYAPAAVQPNDTKWRAIQVAVSGIKSPNIRAKEGYFPE